MLAAGLSWLTYLSVENHQKMDSFSEKVSGEENKRLPFNFVVVVVCCCW